MNVVVVGAGPAGLAAAGAALAAGAEVTLVDATTQLGGQFWRHMPDARPAAAESALHHRWSRFTTLRDRLERHPRCRIRTGAQVWALDHVDGRPRLQLAIGAVDGPDRTMEILVPDALVLATGAHDLTLPFPGWDLPGVVTGGAAQALAKAERVAIGRRVVVAGAGPFLLPVAASLAATGATVLSVHEAAGRRQLAAGWAGALPVLPAMAGKLGELAGYARGQLRGRIPYRVGSGVIAAHGDDRVEAVTIARLDAQWRPVPGTQRTVEADALAVSHGFTPRLELALAAGCRLDAGRFVAVDADQRTSAPGVLAAGEVTGIGGADAALAEGAVAGWIAAGGAAHDPRVARARAAVRRYRRFARALAAAHGPRPGWRDGLTDDTIVCRCEEVPYGRLRATATATRTQSLRSLRLTTRAGLGPCQARICGRVVEELLARSTGAILDDAVSDWRPIVTPLRFGELARTPETIPTKGEST
ncbi:FAD/NAD(P)-binding oxidoreductase [Pseudolysinimonas kribbensis]|uniref:Pyridine nucleotide-disulfide oxidoreductase n=1 Tax=Pseudolysinimonas kribbensis TaxID=433641 RepID=A0ABQ6K4S6_9MICO|nr:FAD/NAD(P)-binding oxidoreductase [Pseudolysinimonas kribbensis]GMA94972.1 pyridine nucleotide-disulfide oxidoreductase [Pseudolysinimonas kribbensis]